MDLYFPQETQHTTVQYNKQVSEHTCASNFHENHWSRQRVPRNRGILLRQSCDIIV